MQKTAPSVGGAVFCFKSEYDLEQDLEKVELSYKLIVDIGHFHHGSPFTDFSRGGCRPFWPVTYKDGEQAGIFHFCCTFFLKKFIFRIFRVFSLPHS